MDLRDFIVAPLLIIVVYAVAYLLRKRLTDGNTRAYYFPAITVKILGALALGFLYQFYYQGGDTFNYHTYGSRVIWEAFVDSPQVGWKLLTSSGGYGGGMYNYASRILFYTDPSSYFIVRIAALFDLLTFSSYGGTAVLFAAISFLGSWALFKTFYNRNPDYHKWLAMAVLFIPSVIFWGSGILKDTITLAALGFLTYSIDSLFIRRRMRLGVLVLFAVCAWIIYSVKIYILLCFIPAAILWVLASRMGQIRSTMLKILLIPFVLLLIIGSGYYAVSMIGRDDPRYSLDRIAVTAQITAYDIGFYTGRDAGSGYSLGELDGTFGSMISKAPQAINVSLYRPYLWEVRNPLMLLSAMESFVFTLLTLIVLWKCRYRIVQAFHDPVVVFALVFSLTFAFAVGVSTFNFGTLTRYKIPLLPFYAIALVYLSGYSKSERKVDVLEAIE